MQQDRHNSFDVIRLFAAFCVFFSHQLAFAGFSEPALGPLGISLASTGLYIFFALSGYLVFKSLERDDRATRYFRARALRIFPGSIVNVGFCLLFGALITNMPLADFWRASQTLSYLFHNASIVIPPTQFELPGVLTNARWPYVNGSIWTIKYELLCYVGLFVVYRAPRFLRIERRSLFLGAALCFIALYVYRISRFPNPEGIEFFSIYNTFNGSRFVMTFFFGALLAAREPYSATDRLLILAIPATLIVFGPSSQFVRAGNILLLTLLVIEIGRSPLLFSGVYRRIGDLSYGVFLYAYPIQIWILTRFNKGSNFAVLTTISLLLILVCAWLSWQFVERKALRYKRPQARRKASDCAAQ